MSRPRGGYIGFNRVPSDSMPGVWTLREHDEGVRSQQWTQFYDRFWVQTRVALNYEPDFTNYAPTTYAGGTSLVNDGNGADAKASFSNVGASTTTAQEYDGSRSAQFVKNSGNYVSVSNGPVLGTGSFTIESWVY